MVFSVLNDIFLYIINNKTKILLPQVQMTVAHFSYTV
jgi:hypothetical protein